MDLVRFLKVLISVLFVATAAFSVYTHIATAEDNAQPVISCDSEVIKISVKDGDEALLKYVTATDSKDGDLTDSVIVESISAFIDGSRKAKAVFVVCDSDNNVTKLEKDIEYTDYTKPEFKITSQQVYYMGAARVDLLNGVTASDVIEGDISSRIVVTDSKIDLSQPGVYPVTYRVTTNRGVTSEVTINTYVYASRLPNSIVLKNYLVYTDVNKKINPDSFISSYPKELTAKDYSKDFEYKLTKHDETDYSKPGIYTVTYRLERKNKDADAKTKNTEILAEAYLTVVVRG